MLSVGITVTSSNTQFTGYCCMFFIGILHTLICFKTFYNFIISCVNTAFWMSLQIHETLIHIFVAFPGIVLRNKIVIYTFTGIILHCFSLEWKSESLELCQSIIQCRMARDSLSLRISKLSASLQKPPLTILISLVAKLESPICPQGRVHKQPTTWKKMQ